MGGVLGYFSVAFLTRVELDLGRQGREAAVGEAARRGLRSGILMKENASSVPTDELRMKY